MCIYNALVNWLMTCLWNVLGLWTTTVRCQTKKSWRIQAMAQQNVEVGTVFLLDFFPSSIEAVCFFLGPAWCDLFLGLSVKLQFWVSCFQLQKRFLLKPFFFGGERKITNQRQLVGCGRSQELYLLQRCVMGRLLGSSGFQWKIPRQWMVSGFGHLGIGMSLPTVSEPCSEMIVNFVEK